MVALRDGLGRIYACGPAQECERQVGRKFIERRGGSKCNVRVRNRCRQGIGLRIELLCQYGRLISESSCWNGET